MTRFVTPDGNELLRSRLETELAPGTRFITHFITHNYTIPGRKVMGVATVGDKNERHDLYLYVIGKK